MSGTSHDGVDIAHCSFSLEGGKWTFHINAAETIPYSKEWKGKLMSLPERDQSTIDKTDKEWGLFMAGAIRKFIGKHKLETDLVASHGHTVFHDPAKKITLQIGDGHIIAQNTGIPVVNDFRTQDVAMGGQGAPLVPVGDRQLFGEYDYCLNIGGISNISFEESGKRMAFDICAVNIVLNRLAGRRGLAYDHNGLIAASGKLIDNLMEQLESLSYYQMSGPRSLGKEWVDENIFPVIGKYENHPLEDQLATYTEHAALRMANATGFRAGQNILVTGGGAYNNHLVSRLKYHSKASITLPDKNIIDFKEALVFGFLGVLRLRGENNVLGSVTGSDKDHSAGVIHRP
jgi:anhydro-N-acetylmuramic acid kinase